MEVVTVCLLCPAPASTPNNVFRLLPIMTPAVTKVHRHGNGIGEAANNTAIHQLTGTESAGYQTASAEMLR